MNEDDRERPKLSWREIDALRGQKRRPDERRPRGAKAEARAKAATEQYLKQADELFSEGPGGAAGDELAEAARAAHGGPEFADACRRYLEELGPPGEQALAALFLDAEDAAVLRGGLAGLAGLRENGTLQLSYGLRARLRTLSDHADDDVAYEAESLLDE